MYAAGGVLQGAASGGMMASMIAPFFGPAAPLVIGVGGLLGGVQGLISANEENTQALKEKAQAEREATSGRMSSVAQGLASSMQEFGLFSGDQRLSFNNMDMTLSQEGISKLSSGGGTFNMQKGGFKIDENNPLGQVNMFMSEKGGEYQQLLKRLKDAKEDIENRSVVEAAGLDPRDRKTNILNKAFEGTVFAGEGEHYFKLMKGTGIEGDPEFRGQHIENFLPQLKRNYQAKMASGFRRENIMKQFGELPSDYRFNLPALREDKALGITKGEQRSYNKQEFLSEVAELKDPEILALDLNLKKVRKKST